MHTMVVHTFAQHTWECVFLSHFGLNDATHNCPLNEYR